MTTIDIKNLSLNLNNHAILNDISEIIPSGKLYYLMGTAGSGKTSFLKAINGLFMEIKGSIYVDGENIYHWGPKQMLAYHRRCSFIFQNSALIGNMSILENLSLSYSYHTNLDKVEITDKLMPLLDFFNLNPSILMERPHFLSTGQRMLLNIIRGLLEETQNFFWDEPIANLDQIERNKVKRMIKDKKNAGTTTVLVSNDWEFGLSIADRVGVLHNGQLIFSGTAEETIQSENNVIRSLISKEG